MPITPRRGIPTPSPAPSPAVVALLESSEDDIDMLFGSLVVVAVRVMGEPSTSVVNVRVESEGRASQSCQQ